MTAGEWTIKSIRFRQGLGELAAGREGVKLRPNELRLAYQLCLETLDDCRPGGRIDFDRWARLLDLKDSKGYRPDKAATVFKTLNELGIVDANPAQATFETRPDPSIWLRARATRARALSTLPELPLRDERPLSEALTQLSHERALEQASNYSADKFSDAMSAKSDDARGSRRQNPTTQETRENTADGASSAKSDASRAGRLQTCTRSQDVPLKTFTRVPPEKSDAGERSPATEQRIRVKGLVRKFVGDNDWFRPNSWAEAGYVWKDMAAVERLERCLNYVIAGIEDGSVVVEKTKGACLWWQYRHQTRKERQEREGVR